MFPLFAFGDPSLDLSLQMCSFGHLANGHFKLPRLPVPVTKASLPHGSWFSAGLNNQEHACFPWSRLTLVLGYPNPPRTPTPPPPPPHAIIWTLQLVGWMGGVGRSTSARLGPRNRNPQDRAPQPPQTSSIHFSFGLLRCFCFCPGAPFSPEALMHFAMERDPSRFAFRCFLKGARASGRKLVAPSGAKQPVLRGPNITCLMPMQRFPRCSTWEFPTNG